jgi:uncharacterized membrane protein YjjP (DUF1212 family)
MEQWVALPIAVGLALLTQAIKDAVPEQYHKVIPLVLTVVGPAVGAGISLLMGGTWQEGAIAGIVGTAGAVYGYEFVHGLRKSMNEE